MQVRFCGGSIGEGLRLCPGFGPSLLWTGKTSLLGRLLPSPATLLPSRSCEKTEDILEIVPRHSHLHHHDTWIIRIERLLTRFSLEACEVSSHAVTKKVPRNYGLSAAILQNHKCVDNTFQSPCKAMFSRVSSPGACKISGIRNLTASLLRISATFRGFLGANQSTVPDLIARTVISPAPCQLLWTRYDSMLLNDLTMYRDFQYGGIRIETLACVCCKPLQKPAHSCLAEGKEV